MRMQSPSLVVALGHSRLGNAIRLRNKLARSLALLALIAVAATALAATSSSAQLLFGKASAMIGLSSAPSAIKAAPANPMLTAPNAPLPPSDIMLVARRGHTATRLSNGSVLIAGGEDSSGVLNECEIYDPTSATFSVTGNLGAARADHSATLLADGRVLIVGGRDPAGALNTTEIFDPMTGAFASGPAMSVARAGHSATLFADGRIFIAGGDANGSAEIFDPSSSSFSAVTANMNTARSMHSAALLADGRVLLVGGRNASGDALSSGEIFDTESGSFSTVDGALKIARVRGHLRVLFDGKVQIIGGSNDGSMEIYDPLYGAFGAYAHVLPESDTCAGLPAQVLASQTRAALFHNGQSDPLFDRSGQTITEMNGQALVLGGANSSGTVLSSSSVHASSSAAITTDKMDYAPGETAAITGRGFQPGETVRVKIHEDPHTPQERGFDTVADADGNFSGEYLVMDYDLKMKFVVGARGLTSGATAQTTFTDDKGVSIAFLGTGSGTVTSTSTPNTSPQINCTSTAGAASGPGCLSVQFNNTARLVLTATPTGGSTIGAWTVPAYTINSGCSVGSSTCDFTMNNTAQTITVTFNAPACTSPSVTTQPTNQNVTYGAASVSFTAAASGSPTPGVQWQVQLGGVGAFSNLSNNATYSGVTTGTLLISNPTVSLSGNKYQAVFTNTCVPATATSTAATLTVNKRNATWTTNPSSKTYGDADPVPLTTGSGDFLVADGVTATYSRVAGENASPPTYHITATLAPAGVLGNYNITNDGAEFSINKRNATWTTNPNSKTYGDLDPVPLTTGSGSNFVAGDGVTATYSRVAGENASPPTYHITATLAPAGVLGNYNITNDGAEFSINKRNATWTTNPNSKTYGDADPVPLATGSGDFLVADGVTATYSRVAGENASPPTYHITATLAPAGVLGNYNITNIGAEFTINKRLATWTTNANSKTYGDLDPIPLTTGSGSNFVAGDGVTATYSRVAGENASPPTYHISATLNATPLSALDNYIVTNDGNEFTINKRLATWTTNANSKTYGDLDPVPLTTGSGSNFITGDGVTATYSRVAGENASPPTYHISATLSATPLSALDNYIITNDGNAFTINKRLATWTTNANSKTYGDLDPVPLTTGSGSNFVVADGVTATYSRIAGENASPPTYHISATLSATPLSALDNYIITNDGNEFTINKRLATWTTNPNSKIYGELDPVPLTTGSGSNFIAGDGVTASYSRVAGENASPPTYHITAALSATGDLNNYIITNDGAEFTINKRLATWTTNPNSKTYGDLDPVPLTTGSGSNFVPADGVSASYSRVAGENASPPTYHISATFSATGDLNNYIITNNGAEFTINKRLATWTTNANSKTYGDLDPVPLTTGSGSNFVAGDGVTATYSRVAGENASPPTYHISATLSATALSALDNYIITNDGNEFTVNKRLATWTTNANSKTYGDLDPIPLTTGSGSNFVLADGVTASYSRVSGESASPPTYHITATLSATGDLNNYIITNDGAEFTINKRLATWTTNANSKTYGDLDPVPLTTGSGSNFVAGDGVTASYSRVAGENASPPTYHITATLSATGDLNNYIITNNGAEFTINKRLATWTTNANSKTYGDLDPVPLTTGSGSNFVLADGVTASYSRVAGENASPPTYHISATLSATGDLNNYIITNDGAEFTINKRNATWTTDPNSKTYGDFDPVPLTTGSGSNFVAGDGVTASYSRVAGENASPPTYHITATLAPAGVLGNYNITNDGAEFSINKRNATWTTDPNSKTYGDLDPVPLTTGSGSNFVAGDGVTASYSRVAGENASPPTYHITATLAPAGVLGNYNITNDGAEFSINKRNATWTTNPNSKTYGDADPVGLTTGSGSNFIAGDGVTATYSRVAGESASLPTYHITATLSATPPAALNNYVITNTGAEFTINQRPLTITANDRAKTYGDSLALGTTAFTTNSGEAPGEAVNSVILTSTSGLASSVTTAAGVYPGNIVPGSPTGTGGFLASNYTITFNNGKLTVNQRPATVTANNKSKIYGVVNPTLDAAVTGTVNGDTLNHTLATTATQFSIVGPYPITVTLGSNPNYNVTKADGTLTITTGYCFTGFLSPIGGSVETFNGGTYADPLRAFKLGSTIPVKFAIATLNGTTCGAPVITGIHTLQATRYSTAVDSDPPIDATPTDAATIGNQFRLTDSQWHFNLSTKGGGFSQGTWLLTATLQDGSVHTVWISIKK